MSDFVSSLIIKTPAKKDLALVNTKNLILINSPFTIQSSPFPKYLYLMNKVIEVYQLKPFTKVKSFNYNEDIMDILVIYNTLIILSHKSLTLFKDGKSIQINGEFNNSTLTNINNHPAVQDRGTLTVYSIEDLSIIQKHKCNAVFWMRDVLITSYEHELSLFNNDSLKIKLFMPDEVTRIVADSLLISIYCGSTNGKIYCINLGNEEPVIFDFHKERITGLDISFCGKYLYSSDITGVVCIWDIKNKTVIGEVRMEAEVTNIKALYISENSMPDDIVSIDK